MLQAAGLVAASEHATERKKQAERQGTVTVGDSDVAKQAFGSQTSGIIENSSAKTERGDSDLKYESPGDIRLTISDTESPSIYSPRPDLQDVRQTSSFGVTSPVEPEEGLIGPGSPSSTMMVSSGRDVHRAANTASMALPLSPSHGSFDRIQGSSPALGEEKGVRRAHSDATTISTSSTKSTASHAIRIKTRGADLKSGFPYHPALVDLQVRPEQWESFTGQLVDATKISMTDNAKVWSAATGVALTGHIIPAIFVGQSMKRATHERSVREGLGDTSDGSLGYKLRLWNEECFSKTGLFVHLELSESSMRKDGKERTFRKPTALFSKGEERDRKREERKFVIVVTKLDDAGEPSEAIREVGTENMPAEIGSSDAPSSFAAVELPAEVPAPVEFPADHPVEMEKKDVDHLEGIVEMSSDNTLLLEKMHLSDTTSPGSGSNEKP